MLAAVSNPISYEINYLDNTGDSSVAGLPAAEGESDITASSFILSNTEPTRTGYMFNGWCYGTVTHVTGGTSTCTGTVYQPGDNFNFSTLSSSATNIANLYAMWEKAIYIQDFTATMCQSQAFSSSVKVMDARDNNIYNVRYINGNCWMVQNLRYVGDEGSSSTSMIMKSATSNIASDQTLPIGDLTSGNDYDNARIHVATADQVPSGATYTATDMGVWYNYAAASAGFVTSNQNTSTESTYSVCPAGWRLPTNSEQSGITSYMSQYFNGGSAVTGGSYYDGYVYDTGRGRWWSSTPSPSGSNYRYFLSYSGSSLGTGSGNRGYGYYVRCIRNTSSVTVTFNGNGATGGSMDTQVINGANSSSIPSGTLNANQFTNGDKVFTGWNTQPNGSGTSYADGATYTASTTGDTTVTLYAQWFDGSTIQGLTNTACQAAASSNSIQVMDTRDNNIYNVRYINGNCWMVQNLRYVGDTGSTSGSMVMKAYTSNIDTDKTVPYTDLTSGDYTNARIHNSGNTTNGVWYNYAAASAGTITGDSNSDTAQYSVCPAGWRLPTDGEQSGIAYEEDAFSPITGGYYYGESAGNTGYGYWWSSTARTATSRNYLYYNSSSILRTNYSDRDGGGFYVRCIRNTSSVTITFNGNGATGGSMDTQVINAPDSSNIPSGKLNTNTFTNGDKTFIGWNTAANGSGTSYADGATYTAPTDGDTTITLYAQWFDGSTIQDLTSTACQAAASSNSIQVMDTRDNNIYNVRYINGNCWMTQNLRYLGDSGSPSNSMVMKAATSNIDTDKTLAYTSLTTTPYNDYNNAKIQNSGNATNGVWYNYAAASAGTIPGSSNSTNATYDICPKGWRLPTNSEQSGITSYKDAFSPVTGGLYDYGSVNTTGYGFWWSSTAYDTTYRYILYYNGSSLNAGYNHRDYGYYVRCVRSS